MVKLEILFKEKKISRVKETELERYINFYKQSYLDNLNHCELNKNLYPRWSIISGYYAMHDVSKLFLVSNFRFKIERQVHATTIKVLREVLKDKEILDLIEESYESFQSLANDLSDAKNERVKVQYYTGSDFMKDKYIRQSKEFFYNLVKPYIQNPKKMKSYSKALKIFGLGNLIILCFIIMNIFVIK